MPGNTKGAATINATRIPTKIHPIRLLDRAVNPLTNNTVPVSGSSSQQCHPDVWPSSRPGEDIADLGLHGPAVSLRLRGKLLLRSARHEAAGAISIAERNHTLNLNSTEFRRRYTSRSEQPQRHHADAVGAAISIRPSVNHNRVKQPIAQL